MEVCDEKDVETLLVMEVGEGCERKPRAGLFDLCGFLQKGDTGFGGRMDSGDGLVLVKDTGH